MARKSCRRRLGGLTISDIDTVYDNAMIDCAQFARNTDVAWCSRAAETFLSTIRTRILHKAPPSINRLYMLATKSCGRNTPCKSGVSFATVRLRVALKRKRRKV